MTRLGLHVIRRLDARWAVTRSIYGRASSVHETKAKALTRGRAQAKREHCELTIYNTDRTVQRHELFNQR